MADTDLLALAECQDKLGVSGDVDLVILQGYITAASAKVDSLCGPVVARSVTEQIDGGTPTITLSDVPVLDISDLQEWDGTSVTSIAEELPFAFPVPIIPTNGYIVDLRSGVVRRRQSGSDGWFPAGRSNVLALYQAGRVDTTADVPAQFREAAFMIVDRLWRLYQATGTSTYGTDGWVPARAVPPMVDELLAAELLPPAVA